MDGCLGRQIVRRKIKYERERERERTKAKAKQVKINRKKNKRMIKMVESGCFFCLPTPFFQNDVASDIPLTIRCRSKLVGAVVADPSFAAAAYDVRQTDRSIVSKTVINISPSEQPDASVIDRSDRTCQR